MIYDLVGQVSRKTNLRGWLIYFLFSLFLFFHPLAEKVTKHCDDSGMWVHGVGSSCRVAPVHRPEV